MPNADGWTRTNNCLSGFVIAVSTYDTKEKMFLILSAFFYNQMFYQLNYISPFIIVCLYYFLKALRSCPFYKQTQLFHGDMPRNADHMD
mgnify:FL=1